MPLSLLPHRLGFLQELSLLSCCQELNSNWDKGSGQDINRKRHPDDAMGCQAVCVPELPELWVHLPFRLTKQLEDDCHNKEPTAGACLQRDVVCPDSCSVLQQNHNAPPGGFSFLNTDLEWKGLRWVSNHQQFSNHFSFHGTFQDTLYKPKSRSTP